MARKGRNTDKAAEGEQLMLLEIEHEAARPIVRAAKSYIAAKHDYKLAGQLKKTKKDRLRELVKGAGIPPDVDGTYHFIANGAEIKITPHDDDVSVKFLKEPTTAEE